MILDSCFLIDLLAGDQAANAKLVELSDRHLVVPALSYTEVAIGIDRESATSDTFDEVLEAVTIIPYDGPAARATVNIQRSQYESGQPIGAIDAMIAGMAIARDEPVVTRNIDEFGRTPVRVSPY